MDTNPMGVSGDAAAEEALTKLLGGDEPEVETEEEATEEVQEDQTEETAESEDAEEAQEERVEEPALEDIEIDGKAFKVPSEVKKGVMLHADYTRKTQEVAESRKVLEERAQLLEAAEQARAATFKKAVEVDGLEQQLRQYEKLDWIAIADQDPAQATKLSVQFQALQRQHANALNDLRSTYQQVQQTTAKERQQTLANTLKVVKEAIPGFNDQVDRELEKHAQDYGAGAFERDAFLKSPALVRMAYDAMQWKKLQESKPALNKKAAEAKPMVKTTSRGIQQSQAVAKIKESADRLKKTGKAGDAEALLTRIFEHKRKR